MRVTNRQRRHPVDVAGLERLGCLAARRCLAHPGPGKQLLAELAEVDVTLVSDRVIARVHAEFSGVPGATDVITFQHGELVISVETAHRVAGEEGELFVRELLRYLTHGLLHLHGHLDAEPAQRRVMWRVQEAILRRVWREGCTD
ncbi:MAG: rRNA maturation RNase YbeY [Verrucomicrobia bacterium]|nr:rRNA maturation RNase YbeY [Verrucomicrobiota bacterium]